jgi:hypothetical protein
MDKISSVIMFGLLCGIPQIVLFFKRISCPKKRCLLYLVCFLPSLIFACLRGNSGTDTQFYRSSFDLIEYDASSIDPLYWWLGAAVKEVGAGFQTFILIHGLITWSGLAIGGAILDQRIPVFGCFLLPILMIDSLFNGLRVGLGFSVLLALYSIIDTGKTPYRHLLHALPGLIHSSLFSFLVVGKRWYISLVGLLFVYYISQADVYATHFYMKSEQYSDIFRPENYSGFAIVVKIIILIAVAWCYLVDLSQEKNLYFAALLFFCLFLYLLDTSYASLRFGSLAVFYMSLAVAKSPIRRVHQYGKAILFMGGLFSCANFLRQISFGNSEFVKFAPYDFFWQINMWHF